MESGRRSPEPVLGHFEHRVARGVTRTADALDPGKGTIGVIDVSGPTGAQTLFQGLVSLAGAAGIALLASFVILLVGLPFALAVRGLLEAVGWLSGVDMR